MEMIRHKESDLKKTSPAIIGMSKKALKSDVLWDDTSQAGLRQVGSPALVARGSHRHSTHWVQSAAEVVASALPSSRQFESRVLQVA